MSAVMDIWNIIVHIVTSADMITLALMVVIALGAGFLMQEMGSILSTTIVALVAFALLVYLRAIVLQGQNASTLAQADWHAFLGLQMQIVLAYAIAFGIVIAIVSAIRSALMR
jgi:hypothetical protein